MTRGRKPKPTMRRQLEGNPGKRPLNLDEPQPPTSAAATYDVPPPMLEGDPEASAEWSRLAPMLRSCRQVTDADRSALAAL